MLPWYSRDRNAVPFKLQKWYSRLLERESVWRKEAEGAVEDTESTANAIAVKNFVHVIDAGRDKIRCILQESGCPDSAQSRPPIVCSSSSLKEVTALPKAL